MNAVVRKLVLSLERVTAGVDYTARRGAVCPWCGLKSRITVTRPWEDKTRIRYHRCENGECPISTLNINIKSIEVDA